MVGMNIAKRLIRYAYRRWVASSEPTHHQALAKYGGDLVPPTGVGTHIGCGRSFDPEPWNHPFLKRGNIEAFRRYSEGVWDFALSYAREHPPEALNCAFSVNMAQNMYNWARLAQEAGARACLFTHIGDETALSSPEWEEFDGEYPDPMDREGFLAHRGGSIEVSVPHRRPPLDLLDLVGAHYRFVQGERQPLLRLLAELPEVRHEALLAHGGHSPYLQWARELSEFDVVYTASLPFAAYASGRPYCVFAVGGDLQFDCGLYNSYGDAMILAFNAARFLTVSNPHALGHSRRLGLTNGVYLPYPMDTDRMSPGNGESRARWEAEYGPGVYVLSSCRLDRAVKGQSDEFFDALCSLLHRNPDLHIVFLAWGNDVGVLKRRIETHDLSRQLILLNPVGKRRLLDYYRSCDFVLDHFVYGYYGTTGLEAACVGRAVVMKLREQQYAPLYAGDVAPVENAETTEQIMACIERLAADAEYRSKRGEMMREWAVRTHGKERCVPLMMALLRLAADRVALPSSLQNPLANPLADDEVEYHKSCMKEDAWRT